MQTFSHAGDVKLSFIESPAVAKCHASSSQLLLTNAISLDRFWESEPVEVVSNSVKVVDTVDALIVDVVAVTLVTIDADASSLAQEEETSLSHTVRLFSEHELSNQLSPVGRKISPHTRSFVPVVG